MESKQQGEIREFITAKEGNKWRSACTRAKEKDSLLPISSDVGTLPEKQGVSMCNGSFGR